MDNKAELTLEALIEADWWDATEWSTVRTTDGDIIVFTYTEVYYIGQGGAITRRSSGPMEQVILT